MFCCSLFRRKHHIREKQNDERKNIAPIDTTVNYRIVSPYSNVIRHDIIQVEPSNVVNANASDTPLFNGTMPDRTSQPLSFDDENSDPVVLATKTENGSPLLDRFFAVNHVSAVNSSKTMRMSSSKSPKTNSSNGVPMARPFDEFATDIMPTDPLDEQSFGTIKSDKD